jgi:hypothetical protein
MIYLTGKNQPLPPFCFFSFGLVCSEGWVGGDLWGEEFPRHLPVTGWREGAWTVGPVICTNVGGGMGNRQHEAISRTCHHDSGEGRRTVDSKGPDLSAINNGIP